MGPQRLNGAKPSFNSGLLVNRYPRIIYLPKTHPTMTVLAPKQHGTHVSGTCWLREIHIQNTNPLVPTYVPRRGKNCRCRFIRHRRCMRVAAKPRSLSQHVQSTAPTDRSQRLPAIASRLLSSVSRKALQPRGS